MTGLSPAAQAIMDAYYSVPYYPDENDEGMLAAAFEALADQVVPEEPELNPLKAWSIEDWNHMNATRYQREETRCQILAIAAELKQ